MQKKKRGCHMKKKFVKPQVTSKSEKIIIEKNGF